MDFSDLLLTLMASETAARQENQTRRRLKAAGFPVQKSLDDFDTSQLNPSVSPVYLNELASCQFIEQTIYAGIQEAGRGNHAAGATEL